MEWYYVLAIILGWAAVTGAIIWLGKTNKLTSKDVGMLSTILSSIDIAMKAVSDFTDSAATNHISILMTLVNKAVLAAENAYYNDRIDAEQRTDYCITQLTDLLAAANVTLTDTQMKVVNTLIAAACEEMGHGKVELKEAQEEAE